MAAEARAMLDALMGTERNEVLPSSSSEPLKRRAKSCYDRDICPLYCAWGIDVFELFTNTKSDLGPNPRKVSNEARDEYLSLPQEEKERLGYEYMLYNKLIDLVRGCDRIVNRNKEKLRQEISRAARARGGVNGQKIDPVTDVTEDSLLEAAEVVAQLEIFEEEVKASVHKIMSLDVEWKSSWAKLQTLKMQSLNDDKEGDTPLAEKDKISLETEQNAETTDNSEEPSESIEDNMKAIKTKLYNISSERQKAIGMIANLTSSKIVPLRDQLNNLTRELYYVKTDMSNDKMVCEVSGNFMSSRDADERIAAHYAGKQYVGWKMVREKAKALDAKYKNYRIPPPQLPYDDGGFERGGHCQYDRGRGSSNGGHRGGGHDSRHYDRSRSRDDRWERHGPQGQSRGGYGGGGYRRDYEADRRRY